MSGFLEIPDGVDQYIDRVIRRCDSLVAAQIWSDIDRNRLQYWFKSFSGIEEQYFAALVLDSLIYRSKAQTKALMTQAIQRLLPELLRPTGELTKYDGKWLETIKKSGVPIRLVPVIRQGDGPNKSGNSVCRDYGNLLNVNNRIIINPDDIPKAKKDGCKLFIFVDDFLGTGNQFSKFYTSIKSEIDGVQAVYLPLCAHESGIKNVKETCGELLISSPDLLGDKDKFLKADSQLLPDRINKYDALRSFYHYLLEKRLGCKIDEPEGYGGLGLVYGFYNATPNATLPLLWSKKNDNMYLLTRN
jgi:hypothetical protein